MRTEVPPLRILLPEIAYAFPFVQLTPVRSYRLNPTSRVQPRVYLAFFSFHFHCPSIYIYCRNSKKKISKKVQKSLVGPPTRDNQYTFVSYINIKLSK